MDYLENAVWIQNAGWVYQNQYVLRDNINKVIYDLNRAHIKHAFINVGWWVGVGAQWTPPEIPQGTLYWLDDIGGKQWSEVINTLKAGVPGLKVHAWAINNGDMLPWVQDPTKWAGMDAEILNCFAKGFDAYHDDIESTGNISEDLNARQLWINYVNHIKPLCDSVGKMSSIATGLDWKIGWNKDIVIDLNANMFLGMVNGGVGSIFEDVAQRRAFWNENFGNSNIWAPYEGNTAVSPPASPILVGIYNATSLANIHPLDLGLDWLAEELATADPHVNLAGFCFWLYEYMNETDWSAWAQFFDSNCTKRARTVNATAEIPVTLTFDNAWTKTTPRTELFYDGQHTLSVPSATQIATHHVVAGNTDHAGLGCGYEVYIYAGGPFELPAGQIPPVYLFTNMAGKFKVGIYNSREYSIPDWITTPIHPDQLLTKSVEVDCLANSWNRFELTPANSLGGKHFIAVKTNLNAGNVGPIGTTDPALNDWHFSNQHMPSPYADDFPQTYIPEGTGTGYVSAYFASAPPEIIERIFSGWDDGTLTPTKIVNITADKSFMALYGGTPPPTLPFRDDFIALDAKWSVKTGTWSAP